jgi:trehalose 6-phosphate phosphatase
MPSGADLPSPPPLRTFLASHPLALFLDFDGTLVEIAERPDAIDVPAGLAEQLEHLHSLLEGRLALVSGRAIEDLDRHCGPLPVACAGSHGAEVRLADGTSATSDMPSLPAGASAELARFAAERGLIHEDKTHGEALHWRGRPEFEEECLQFMEDVAARHTLSLKHGKRVAELVAVGTDKGVAVRGLMARPPFCGARPMFVGDDVTDEDGFAASRALGGWAIAVGDRETCAADYGLADPAAVQQWLAA